MSQPREWKMPMCTWCGRMAIPNENFIRFLCPNCTEVTVTRCQKCRIFGRPYKCPKCGFTGP